MRRHHAACRRWRARRARRARARRVRRRAPRCLRRRRRPRARRGRRPAPTPARAPDGGPSPWLAARRVAASRIRPGSGTTSGASAVMPAMRAMLASRSLVERGLQPARRRQGDLRPGPDVAHQLDRRTLRELDDLGCDGRTVVDDEGDDDASRIDRRDGHHRAAAEADHVRRDRERTQRRGHREVDQDGGERRTCRRRRRRADRPGARRARRPTGSSSTTLPPASTSSAEFEWGPHCAEGTGDADRAVNER